MKLQLDSQTEAMLKAFKAVFDGTMEEKTNDQTYVSVVVSEGLKKMLSDVTGQDPNILADTMRLLFEGHPQSVVDFVLEMHKSGKEIAEERAKEARATWGAYIR